jgi:fido (protein-threonine AMPylation protein)
MLGKAEHLGKPPTWFTPPHLLEHEAERIFDSLNRANLFRGLRRVEFARKGARLLAEINKLHPFRRGTGARRDSSSMRLPDKQGTNCISTSSAGNGWFRQALRRMAAIPE